jgi:hypothetical protein
MSARQLRGELVTLVRDLAAVSWCRLRGAHFIEPDECGIEWRQQHPDPSPVHEWCSACGWCATERERRTDLVGLECDDRGRNELVLP